MTNISRKELITGMLLFSVFGLMVETTFTGLSAAWSGSFKGGVSLLMIPVYCLSYFIGIKALPLIENTTLYRWYFRLPLIVVTVYSIEWSFGALYQSVGLHPWHYNHGWASEFSNGNITLYFLPAWLFFALIVVPAIRIVRNISPTFLELLSREIP